MKKWKEINGVYASNDVYLPLLGTGITRFEDRPKDRASLLRCMLYTFNSSGVSLNAKVLVVIYGNAEDIPLYEYKDIFCTMLRLCCFMVSLDRVFNCLFLSLADLRYNKRRVRNHIRRNNCHNKFSSCFGCYKYSCIYYCIK